MLRALVSRALDPIGVRLYRRFVFRPARTPQARPEGGAASGAWESVWCSRSDGHGVAGLWGRAEGGARGVVVCAHPFKRSGTGFFLEHGHAAGLRRAGYHVLLFDFGGFGETPQQSVLFPRDVLAAGEEAVRRAPGLPVGFLGVCFGAVYGACAFATPGHPFQAAVLDAPYANEVDALRAMSASDAPSRPRRVQTALVRWGRPLFPTLDPLRQASRAIGLRGVLMIAGGADDLSPPAGVRRYVPAFARAGIRCERWTVAGAEHLDAFKTAPEAYAERVVSFFDRHLAVPADRSAPARHDRPARASRAGWAAPAVPAAR